MKRRHGFTLVEILLVTAIIITIGTALLFQAAGFAERRLVEAEDKRLEQIRDEIVRSFDSEDLDTVNVLAVAGAVPSGVAVSRFSEHNLTGSISSVSTTDWFAKIAKLRGLAVTTGGALTAASQPELYKIAYNSYGRPRALYAGPAEGDKQRFVLVSLMAREEQFAFPAYEAGATWFDALFNTNWNTQQRTTPAAWGSRLSAEQLAAWNGSSSEGSNLWRLRVLTFTVSKLSLHMSNGHPTDSLIVTADAGGTTYTVPPGGTSTQLVFAGRTVRVFQGSTTNPAARTFVLRKASDVIIE